MKTPGELRAMGFKTLPCGFPLASNFGQRLKHYRLCTHPFCQERLKAADEMYATLKKGLARR